MAHRKSRLLVTLSSLLLLALVVTACGGMEEPAFRLGDWGFGPVVYSPDGQWLAVAASRGVHLYSATAPQERRFIQTDEPVEALALSPDGTILAAGLDDGTVTLWRVADGELLHTLTLLALGGFLTRTDGECRMDLAVRTVYPKPSPVHREGTQSLAGFSCSVGAGGVGHLRPAGAEGMKSDPEVHDDEALWLFTIARLRGSRRSGCRP